MTKVRPPLSLEAALARIAGQLPGAYHDMAAAAGRALSTVRAWSNPDLGESIPMECAIRLDIAFQQAGGIGAPIFDTYALQLETGRAEVFATQAEIARGAMAAIKEGSEAAQAQIACTLPGATKADFIAAVRETEEAVIANTNTLALLKQGAGLCGGASVYPGEGKPSE